MNVVGLVSSYREGPLLASAMRSLAPLDGVVVCEGPIAGSEGDGPESERGPLPLGSIAFEGVFPDDAAKRTAILERAKRQWQGPTWGLWLDGDELLLWGEYLHDWLWRVEQEEGEVAGFPFPLVELDGSVVICMGKLVRIDRVKRYLVSSSYIELVNGSRRTVGNVAYWNPVDGPLQFLPDGRPHWRARPPLQGEPHLLHRSLLRARGRTVERQGVAEERSYRLAGIDGVGPDAESPS